MDDVPRCPKCGAALRSHPADNVCHYLEVLHQRQEAWKQVRGARSRRRHQRESEAAFAE